MVRSLLLACVYVDQEATARQCYHSPGKAVQRSACVKVMAEIRHVLCRHRGEPWFRREGEYKIRHAD